MRNENEFRYAAQKRWHERNDYGTFAFRTYHYIGDGLRNLAKQKGMSVSKLICNAILIAYKVDLSKSEQGKSENEFGDTEPKTNLECDE